MISRDDIAYLARLCRLELGPDDYDAFAPPLREILAYVEKLNQLDTSGVEPTPHVLTLENVMQNDVVLPSLSHDEALQSAPDVSGGFFHVPPVIE